VRVHSEGACSQVQALRSVEKYLGLDALYIMGTNCVDNGRRGTLDKFLAAASSRPDEVLHYGGLRAGAVAVLHAPSSPTCWLCFMACLLRFRLHWPDHLPPFTLLAITTKHPLHAVTLLSITSIRSSCHHIKLTPSSLSPCMCRVHARLPGRWCAARTTPVCCWLWMPKVIISARVFACNCVHI